MSGDPFFNNVVSLLHFDGADASTTFTDVTGKTWTAAGNAQLDTAQSKFGSASGLFDGIGDYISTPSHSDFAFGTSDFTAESFVRVGSLAAVQEIMAWRHNGDNDNFWFIRLETSGAIRAYAKTSGSVITDITSTGTVGVGAWVHIAVVRSGGAVKIYVNGANSDTVTTNGAGSWPTVAYPMLVGAGDNVSGYFNGHIDDLRITKGVARYTAGFTPPAAAFPDTAGEVPSTVGVVSLLHFQNADNSQTFTDVMGKQWYVFGNTKNSITQSKFGGLSGYFDGSGDYLTSAHPDFGFGDGDWTWEAWVRPTAAIGNEGVFDTRLGGSGIGIYTSISSASNAWGVSNDTAVIANGSNLTAGVWAHLAVSRSGGTIRGFKNGVLDFTVADARVYASSAMAIIGTSSSITQPYNGYIDEMRVTKGQARYTLDFPVATAAFIDPIDPLWSSVTSLLHFEGVDGATTFTDETEKLWSAVGEAQLDTAQSKFGNASGLFDGTGDALESSTAGLIDLSADFTIEYWVRQSAAGGTVNTHLHLFDAGGFNGGLSIYRTVATGFLVVDNGLTATTVGTIAIPLNTWTHIAIVRDGGNIRAYINGVQCMNNPVQTYPAINTIRVGLFKGALYSLTGHIDELRITNGICRYPGGTTFTPSSEPFPTGIAAGSGSGAPVTHAYGFVS